MLCTEWESNIDLEAYYLNKIPSLEISDKKIMELNPIYKYNMQIVPLQKCMNNIDMVDTMKSLKFLPYSNNIYPCLVGFHAAVDYYVTQANVKTYDEYISCMYNALYNRYTSWFKEDIKLFNGIKAATLTDVIVKYQDSQIKEDRLPWAHLSIYACRKTGLYNRGFPLYTILFLIRDYTVEKTYIDIITRFSDNSEDAKRLIIFNLIVIDAIYTENGIQYYFEMAEAIKDKFYNDPKDERRERILELKSILYMFYSLSPEYSKF